MKAISASILLFASSVFAQPTCNYELVAPRAFAEAAYDRVFTADFDGDGRLDVGFGSEGVFTIRYGLGAGKLTGSLTQAIDVLAVADVVGDSLPDLIGAAEGGVSPTRLVHRNRDGRLFADPIVVAGLTFVAADFTNDGRGDLITHDSGNFRLYERAGNTLTARTPQQLIDLPRELEAGDVNGDGFKDLLVLNSDGTGVRVLLNDGHGAFTQARILRPGDPALELEVADFRRDGRADVLTVSQSLGQGFRARLDVFPDAQEPATTTMVFNPDGLPSSLLVRDVTGDGAPDVLMLMTYSGIQPRVVVHVNDGGTLRRVEESLFAPHLYPIEAADFTGDGLAELVMATPNGFALVTGEGDGTFYWPAPMEQLARKAYLTPYDFDGDGDDDLVYMEDTTSVGPLVVAMNDGTGHFTVAALLRAFRFNEIDVSVSNGEIVVIEKSFTNDQPVYVFSRNAAGEWVSRDYDTVAEHAVTHDLDGDGLNELITIEHEPFFEGPGIPPVPGKTLRVLSGKDKRLVFDAPLGAHLDANVAVDDVTGDGRPDLIVTTLGTSESAWYPPNRDGEVRIYAGRGNGTFHTPETLASQLTASTVVTGDFNGDGHRDIVFTTWFGELHVAYGTGSGPGPTIATGHVASEIQTADLNGDGITDLFTAAAEEVTVWFGSRAGLTRDDMYWTHGVVQLARLKQGGPYSLISNSGVVTGICVPTRRRSVAR